MTSLFNWHWLATIAKSAATVVVLLLSAILSYTFFKSISPPGMDVFPFAALSLTEGGLVIWLLIFSAMKHHVINSLIALIMIGACLITTLVITFAELIQLFQDHSLVDNATVVNGTLILLEVMLGLHLVAAMADFLVGKIEWLIKTYVPQRKEEHTSDFTPVSVTQVQSEQTLTLEQMQQALSQAYDEGAKHALDKVSPLAEAPLQANSYTGQNGRNH